MDGDGSMRNNIIRQQEAPTYCADIFIAGSLEQAREACRDFCLEGLCVSISPCNFVYTGGCESGVRIGLINYPRFPTTGAKILETAVRLAEYLIVKLHQGSASVVATDKTVWLTRRASDL